VTRVLYVMGLYRSGSTILDILLGNQPGLSGVGELRNLPIMGWEGVGVCACGQPVHECDFWRTVRSDWEQKFGADCTERLKRLQGRFERIRSFPAVSLHAFGRSRQFEEYSVLLGGLFEAIRNVSGSDIIVDSTKYPARAWALLRNRDIDLQVIHLVRDGRAVIWSMMRQLNTDLEGQVIEVPRTRIAFHTTRQWLLTNLASDLVRRSAGTRAMLMRYEDLVHQPARELERIGSLIDADMTDLTHRILDGADLGVGHTVAGNRVRMGGAVRLRPDTEWQSRLPAGDRATFWRLAGWLAKCYGYSKDVVAAPQ
jgi:Sulfotransferase family